ncbi:hypothetical protein P7C73_g5302, partial [Tremellales sp. Uapishka_1]
MGGEADSPSALKDLTFGSVAGMTAKVFEHPFDLVKVRLQSQPTDRPLSFTGPLDCFKQTYSKEGWRGLYRGLSAPLVGAASENACLFLVYNKCQALIRHLSPGDTPVGTIRELSTGELAIAAGAAGAAASFVLTPIELIKCRMQVQMLSREGTFGATPSPLPLAPPQGPFSLLASVLRTSGIRGLWLGQVGTLFRETGGSSAWFTAYNVSSGWFVSRRQAVHPERKVTKKDLKTHELMISGALAGMSYNVVLFPADSVKSAMQTSSELHPGDRPPEFWKTAARIWRSRGFKGLYAGCGLTVARAAPSSAMIFLIYESLEKRFG